jgi:hypothetical protein
MVSFMPRPFYPQGKSPWYLLYWRLGGPQSRSECGDEEKNFQPLPGLEPPKHPARSLTLFHSVTPAPSTMNIHYKISTSYITEFCNSLFGTLNDHFKSRDSSVGTALGYGLDDQGFKSRQGLGIFLFTTASRTALGPTQPPIQWVPGAPSLGVKQPGREADHSPPSSAEIKECVELYLHSQYAFMA